MSAVSGVDPLVAAVLAVTPLDDDGQTVTRYVSAEYGDQSSEFLCSPVVGDPQPVAARQAAAVLRWLREELWNDGYHEATGCVDAIVDQLELAVSASESHGEPSTVPGGRESGSSALYGAPRPLKDATSAEVTTPETGGIDLDAIRFRVAKATEGSWAIWDDLNDQGFITHPCRPETPMTDQTSAEVYEAAARAYCVGDETLDLVAASAAKDQARRFRAAVDVAYAAGLAAATSGGERRLCAHIQPSAFGALPLLCTEVAGHTGWHSNGHGARWAEIAPKETS